MVFGLHAVMECIESGKEVEKIFLQKNHQDRFTPLKELARAHNIPISMVPKEKLNRITTKNHQGVVAYISPIAFVSVEQIIESCFAQGRDPLLLILDRVTDVRNFGAIIRSAAGFGVDAVVVPATGGALLSGDAMKTSAGALSRVPICRARSLLRVAKYLQESGIQMIACTEKGGNELFEHELTGPTALILGSEENGISSDLLKMSDQLLKIPISGVESLNVSVAAAVGLYECIRQRSLNS